MLEEHDVQDAKRKARLAKLTSIEWLGQMVASLCWVVSALLIGLTSTADWLQLCAASAWTVANIAAIVAIKVD